MKQIKISQSLIKDWNGFINEDVCGSVFEAKYVTNTWVRTWNDSESKAIGRYFEFILTGAMPTGYKEYPKAQYYAATVKKMAENKSYRPKVSEMLKEYQLAHRNADRVLLLFKKTGIKIESAQVFREKGALTGNIDIEADFNGLKINIDVKYSGLIHDKWSLFGWRWTPPQMEYNGIQAKQYSVLNGRPTYFLVVSSTNDKDIEFFKAEITPEDLKRHEEYAVSLIEKIAFVNEFGWKNYPSLSKCADCPLKNTCSDAVNTLIPTIIYITDN
jgi:hypothetical protein